MKDKIPSLEEYAANLKTLRCWDFSNASQAEIIRVWKELTLFIPTDYTYLWAEAVRKLSVFRCRPVSDSEDIGLISTYSYPKSEHCSSNGRANLAGKPVFYGSDSIAAVLQEIKEATTRRILVGYWTFPKCDRHLVLQTLVPKDVPVENKWKQFILNNWATREAIISTSGMAKPAHLQLLFHFISDLFQNEKSPYHLTSWLAHNTLYQSKKAVVHIPGAKSIDAVLYPCVSSRGHKSHLAFHPSFIDEYAELRYVAILKMNSFHATERGFDILRVGRQRDGEFEWAAPTKENRTWLYDDDGMTLR